MSAPLTRSLGTFVAELRLPAIPADALSVVHTGFADCVGTMIAGCIEDPPRILLQALSPPAGDASLYLVGQRVPAPEAAWINGTAAHALAHQVEAGIARRRRQRLQEDLRRVLDATGDHGADAIGKAGVDHAQCGGGNGWKTQLRDEGAERTGE